MPSKKTTDASGYGRRRFANRLIHALTGGGHLQGEFELCEQDPGDVIEAGLFYIEDVPTHAATEAKAIKDRIRDAPAPDGRSARIPKSATFKWVDEEIRARSCAYLIVQPFNILLVAESVVSYEDLQSHSPLPLWGSVSLYRDKRTLGMAFDSQTASTMREVLGAALKQAHSAIGEVAPRNRVGAIRRLERFTDRIRSTSTTGE